MDNNAEFRKQLEDNRPYEDIAIQKAIKHFDKESPDEPLKLLRRPDDANYNLWKFDGEIGNGSKLTKLEVKTDHKSVATGNLFIEYFGYGKPSGIAITEADYYIINDTVDYYMISVARLFRIIERYDEVGKLKRVECKSTSKHVTKGYIVRKAVVLKFATLL